MVLKPFPLANTGCAYNSEKSERGFKRKNRPYVFDFFFLNCQDLKIKRKLLDYFPWCVNSLQNHPS